MENLHKGLKFIVSGGTAAGTKLVLFLVLISYIHIYYLLASAIAFLLSVVVGFYMQKYFTFGDASKAELKKQALWFFGISLVNLFINLALMYAFVSLFGWNDLLSQILAIGIIACWNFFVYRKFVFK